MTQIQVPLQFYQRDKFSFSEFIGNESVVESLSQFDQLPQFTYLWGEKFSGKSHLLVALENKLLINGVQYLSLNAEMIKDDEVVSHLPEQLAFLLINDIDQLQSGAEGELALFNLYNWCRSRDCKLVVSANTASRSKLWQLPDLQSRLNSGLLLSLVSLKGELALKCIKQQFAKNGIPIDAAVLTYLSTTQNTGYSYLYQLFLQIAAESLSQKRKVTVPLVKKTIQAYQVSLS